MKYYRVGGSMAPWASPRSAHGGVELFDTVLTLNRTFSMTECVNHIAEHRQEGFDYSERLMERYTSS